MNKYLLILLTLLTAQAHAASKWIDEQGKVHYSDQLPPVHAKSKATLNIADTPLTTAPAASAVSGVSATNKPATDAKKPALDKKAAAEKAALDASNKEIKQSNCTAAKQNLANLKDGMRIATIDPTTGERSYLDDAQRAKSIDEAQQQISKNCQ